MCEGHDLTTKALVSSEGRERLCHLLSVMCKTMKIFLHICPEGVVLMFFFFFSGDIGEWQSDGSMKIIDRKKNIFKLSQGEYVAVENLESIYSRCNLITSVSFAS